MSRVIGLSGLAGSGKDLFYTLLEEELPNVRRFALADALKLEIRQSCFDLYKIDIITCSRQEKDLVRPFLVSHGKIKRQLSNGTYWTGLLTPEINKYLAENPNNIACVTDIRYDFYPEDEIFWLRNKMNGFLVHIATYKPTIDGQRVYLLPPNEDEKENDPKLIAKADYNVEWPRLISSDNKNPDWSPLKTYVKSCIAKFNA